MAIDREDEIARAPKYPSRILAPWLRKVLAVSDNYDPTTAADFDATITSRDDALDEIASRVRDIESGGGVVESLLLESSCALVDATDNTKTLKWNLAAQSTGVDLTVTSAAEVADRVINIPVLGADQTFTFNALSQVLENKQLEATCYMCDTTDNTKTLKWNLAAQTAGVDITITSGAEAADRVLNIPVLGADQTLTVCALSQVLENKQLEATCYMCDTTDNTKTLKWNLAAQTAGVDITITSGAEAADRVLNIPVLGADQTLAVCALSQVFENKIMEETCYFADTTDNTKTLKFNLAAQATSVDLTITSSAEAADRVLTIPVLGADQEFTFNALAQVLENKSLEATCSLVDTTDNTKALAWDLSGATTAKTLTLSSSHTDDRTLTVPDADATIISTNVAFALAADGSANQVLVTNGSGTLSFSSATYAQQEASGTIATADILTMNATPVELIADPGAGKVIVVDEIELFLDYGSAAYVRDGANEELVIQYSGGTDIHAFATATDTFLTSAADAHRIIRPTIYNSAAANFDPTTGDNESVVAYITYSEVITGDSDINYKIRYRIVTLLS